MNASIERFLASAETLDALVKDLPEYMLNASVAPGEWTIRHIVQHLADDGELFSSAVKKAVAAPGAYLRFEGFPGNEVWSTSLGYAHRPVPSALALFRAHHQTMAEVAELASPDSFVAVLDDKGNHFRNMTVFEILDMLSDHLEEHLETIKAIRQ